ncbi:Rib/alpha-like domain-containing protein [Lactobacillus crispatus]|uniref:Rib/alpha-like domain-containing protein n=1 Tax=Lactobacillus crispatus TaxID=47770 RepID=UPI0018E39305|nr:Rib/alpha-like domain-containing protein [Lactobacillus crispatus]MBI1700821.1 Rib/alpha-like repeat protein [Lactobacillus crispatus]
MTVSDIVPVKINVKKDAESYTVTPNNEVSVDKGEDVDPASLVTVTDPDGKQVQLPAGSIDWKDGAKPDLTTPGDKTGSVEVTFLDGSKKDTDVTIHVKTDAETYDSQAQPWTTTVGKTPKADEVISSTDKNGKKMPSDAKYTWKTEPDTSKTGEASGVVKVTYSDESQDEVPVTINVKDKLDDKEKYHIYGKDGLKVDKNGTLAPQDAIDVKDADGNKTTLPENSIVEWTKKPDFSQAGKDVTGEVTVTYPDPDHSKSDPVTVTVHVNGKSDEYKVAPRDGVTVPRGSQVDPERTVVAQTPDGQPASFPDGTTHKWVTPPDTSTTGNRTGVVETTFPDGSTTRTTVTVKVQPNQSDKYDPHGPENPDDRVPVKNPDHLTGGDKDNVKGEVGKVNPDLPKDTEVTVDDKGNATIIYSDGSKDKIPGGDLVRPEKDADKNDPKGPKNPDDRVPVKDPDHLTDGDKDKVKDEIGKENPDLPGTIDVDDKGNATITYPDGSKDTIPGGDLVRQEDKDKYDPKGPKSPDDRVPVKDPDHLTDGDKDKVKGEVGTVNPDLPKGTEVTVGDDGTATIKYPDGSKDKIPGGDLVRPENDADKYDPKGPKNPDDRVPVKDPDQLTDGDKDKVKGEVGIVNPDLPKGTEVTVDDKGNATITYPDGSKDKIPGGDLVRPENDADRHDPHGPENPDDRVPVKDPDQLTDGDKDKVKGEVGTVNPDLPKGTEVAVGDDGTATIKYPDGSKDKIPGGDLVRPENDADKYDPKGPKNPDDRVPVKDPEHLTKDDKDKVKDEVGKVNPDLPGTIDVDDKGNATITYPDGSKDTIPGGDLVRPENDADNITPNIPGDKVTVKDPSHLTDDEKNQVKNNVDNANKDKFPAGTVITVGDDGTATITYPDTSTDTIPGDKLVKGEDSGSTSGQTDAGNITPNIPGDKVTVKDPSHLTDDEKNQVKNNVDNANKDKFPAGTEVIVGNDGTATITYPDGSQDIIPGDQLVQGQKGDTTDAGNITPTIPGGKVTVKDPSHLTDDEKNQVKDNVDNANKDKFPAGTEVTVGDDGTATIKYPDGSQDTIPGDQLVQGQKGDTTDAGNITPTIPGGKVTVKDPSHLTDDEKNQVKNNVDNANKDKFPAGTVITVGDDGTTTVTYPDGSKDVIAGTDLVIAAKSEDVPGSKHHSHKNGSNSSQADGVKGASTANGSIANAGNNLGVKGESDNAIGNNKATSLKTLPQTGTKDTSILGVLGMLLASLGLFVFKKKRDKE